MMETIAGILNYPVIYFGSNNGLNPNHKKQRIKNIMKIGHSTFQSHHVQLRFATHSLISNIPVLSGYSGRQKIRYFE